MNNLTVNKTNQIRFNLDLIDKPTYRHAAKTYNDFLDTYQGDNPVFDFFRELKKTKCISTQKTYRTALKKSIEQLLRENSNDDSSLNLFRLNEQFKKIKIGQTSIAVSKEKCLNEIELKKSIDQAGYKTSLIIKALYETAVRVTELVNIKFSDCMQRENGMLIKIIRKRGREDFVYMSIDLFSQIKEVYQGTKYLFESSKKPGQPISRINVYNLIKGAGKKINREDIHPHIIRHTFATMNIDKLGLAKTSAYLGHLNQDTTAKYYLHGKPDMDTILNITKGVK